MSTAVAESIAIETLIKAQAYGVGFDLVGITSLGAVETAAAFDAWIARGYAGDMEYLPRGADKRRDTRLPVPGATHAIVVGLQYGGREPAGPIARYARGDDYHDLMIAKLNDLHRWLESEIGRPVSGKPYVDTGPVLERDLARRAGLGWFGKNTNLINPKIGSFFFIGALFVDIDLKVDAPFDADRCGTCTRCLDACPTNAFVKPHVLDATRCISYLTIEKKGSIPEDLRQHIGGLLYGCDICQDVCPWNVSFAREIAEDSFRPREILRCSAPAKLARDFLAMSEEVYRERFKGSAMRRAKRRGLARNAAVVLGNIGGRHDIPALLDASAGADPLVRDHIDCAVSKIAARYDGPAASNPSPT
jgi:epoxyqueuosine reductase